MSVSSVKEKVNKTLRLYGGSIPDREFLKLKEFAENNGVDEIQLRYQILPDLLNSFNQEAYEKQKEDILLTLSDYLSSNFGGGKTNKLKPLEVERFISLAYDNDIRRDEAIEILHSKGFDFSTEGSVKNFKSHKAYARTADRAHGFSQSQVKTNPDSESLFELDILSPVEAEFRLHQNKEALKYALEDVESFFALTCDYQGQPERGAYVSTTRKGKLKLKDNVWEIVKKAQIRFGEEEPKIVAARSEPNRVGSNQKSSTAVKSADGSVDKTNPKNIQEPKVESDPIKKEGGFTWVGVLVTIAALVLLVFVLTDILDIDWSKLLRSSGSESIPKTEYKTDALSEYSSSSHRDPIYGKKTYTYEVDRIHDGDITTAWVEGANGLGRGEWVSLSFNPLKELGLCRTKTQDCIEIVGFEVFNGLGGRSWTRNGRVKKLEVVASGNETQYLELADVQGLQTVRLSQPLKVGYASTVKLKIASVIAAENDRDKDVCISELYPIFNLTQEQLKHIGNADVDSIEESNDSEISNSKPKPKPTQSLESQNPRQLILDYFSAEDNRDLQTVMSFWSESPTRYWDIYYPELFEIKKRYRESWKAMSSSSNRVVNIEKRKSNIYAVETEFSFVDRKQSRGETKYSTVVFEFDTNDKITSQYLDDTTSDSGTSKSDEGTSQFDKREKSSNSDGSESMSNDSSEKADVGQMKMVRAFGPIPDDVGGRLNNISSFKGWRYPFIDNSKVNFYRMMQDRKPFFMFLDLDEDGVEDDFCARIELIENGQKREVMAFGIKKQSSFKYHLYPLTGRYDYLRKVDKGNSFNDRTLESPGVAVGRFDSSGGEIVFRYDFSRGIVAIKPK